MKFALNLRLVLVMLLAAVLVACASDAEKLAQGRSDLESQNYAQAYKTLLPLAEDGNADAQYAVGYLYYYGQGVKENPAEAKRWMRKAASQGQPLAIQALKLMDEANPPPQGNVVKTTTIASTAASEAASKSN